MSLTREDRLLLTTSHTALSPAQQDRARRLARSSLDWDYILRAAVRHAVAPLVCAALEEVGDGGPPDGVPPAAWRELMALRRGSGRRNARLYATVADISARFSEAGIALIGLKDLQLAAEVYPEVGLRPMGDVDLLVHRADVVQAADVLRTLGFRPVPDTQRPYAARHGVGQQHRRAQDETWIDLQWHVSEREWDRHGDGFWSYDTDGMWERAVPLRVGSASLLAPAPVDMLLHLCLHLEGHEYCELVLFSDLVEFIRHYGPAFDWDGLVERAIATASASAVHGALDTAARLLDLQVPQEVMHRLHPSWFAASLYIPLFANLTSLHQSLDDLHVAASPPRQALETAERSVRAQAALASQACRVVSGLVDDISSLSGGGPVLVDVGAPERWFPAPPTPELQELRLCALVEHETAVVAALERAGLADDSAAEWWSGTREWVARDPLLLGDPLRLDVHVIVGRGGALAPRRVREGNARAALRSLRAATRGRRAGATATLTARVSLMTAAELVATAFASVGSAVETRLFEAASALRVLERLPVAVSAEAVLAGAEASGAEYEVRQGAAVVAGLGGPVPEGLLSTGFAPRVLEWARYGPSALDRRPELRDAFGYAQVLLLLRGAARRQYAASTLRPGGTGATLLVAAARAVLRRARRRSDPADATQLAYWAEPVYDEPAGGELAAEQPAFGAAR